MAETTAGVCEPLNATAEPAVARASCAMAVGLPPNARGRPVRSDRVRFGGKHCGATAIRGYRVLRITQPYVIRSITVIDLAYCCSHIWSPRALCSALPPV